VTVSYANARSLNRRLRSLKNVLNFTDRCGGQTEHPFACGTVTQLHETAAKAFKRAAIYAELAFMRILGQEYGAVGLYQAFSKEGIEQQGRLMKYWLETLSPRVTPFSFEPDPVETPGFVDPMTADTLACELLEQSL